MPSHPVPSLLVASRRTTSPGRLVSIEGISGVGKTHLTRHVLTGWLPAERPMLLEEFSRRCQADQHDLGRDLLHVLISAAAGDPFLRGGHPRTETMLLLAIKAYDYEASLPALAAGRVVIEGRSLDTVAVYQSLFLEPDDDEAAYDRARSILSFAARWRPFPDHTILLVDDVAAAVYRAETRDSMRFTPGQWRVHHRAAALFERLAAADQGRVRVLDLRRLSGVSPGEGLRQLLTDTAGVRSR